MAKGSQLSQLKSALSQAGLSNQSQPNKKRKHAGSRDDMDKRARKLKEINAKLNPFDVQVTKLKHEVVGRKVKGAVGHPLKSRQTGIEQRTKTLLKEHQSKNKAGGFVDRRFGENDPSMSLEERMLERFTKEKQRASKGAAYNLEDEDDLTHYGQSLSMLDDFDASGLTLGDESDSDGKIDKGTVSSAHFGGFEDPGSADEDEDEPARKKSKAEIMSEIIAKSKQHKAERQHQKAEASEMRHQLDQELDDIRGLLFASPADPASLSVAKETKDEDQDYDKHVRELVHDKRAQPKDRTKTEEELALEAKEALEKAERKRLKRMNGESDSESDDEHPGARVKRRRKTGGDDLEDDFHEAGQDWDALGGGLDVEEDDEGERGSDEDSEETESADSDESGEEAEAQSGSAEEVEEEEEEEPVQRRRDKGKGKEELPFTFPCPSSLEEFLEIVDSVDGKEVPIVIQRIRTLYHPSLDQLNKQKLQAFLEVLIDYVLHVASPPSPNFGLLPVLSKHIHSLTTSYPIAAAEHCVSKLKIMQKNLSRGLSKGASNPSSKTWPGTSELAFFWAVSRLWPTSDMNHNVVSPTRLLMGAYLGLSRIRSLNDVCSGLFLCTLFLQYEEHSKRFVPELVTFLLNALLYLSVHKYSDPNTLPGAFPSPDLASLTAKQMKARRKGMKGRDPKPPDLVRIMMSKGADDDYQQRVDLLSLTLELIGRVADAYKSLDAFTEAFGPVAIILDNLDMQWASAKMKNLYTNKKDNIDRLLKFARQSKRPLTLQAHKPIPIATYIPKLESSSSGYFNKHDPDHERAAASKLRYQYKQERKGAIRELRKDSRFLSAVKHKEQQDRDQSYSNRMNKVMSSMESERAEQKQMEREKQREKRRAGRK